MRKALSKIIPNNRFVKGVSVLSGGAFISQLIVIAASPILTRLYSPQDFGILAVFGGLLGILAVIASLRYQLAIPIPEKDSKAASIAVLSIAIVIGMSLLLSFLIWLFGSKVVKTLNVPELESYLWLIPIALFLVGLYQVLQYWAVRSKMFSVIAKTRFTQSLSMVLIQIGGYAFGPVSLILGRIVGQSAGIFNLLRGAVKRNKTEFKAVQTKSLKSVSVEYKNFPLVSTWTGLASSAGLNLTPLLIAAFLGAGAAGLFSLAHRVLSQPMTVIGKSVSDVFYQKAVESNREGNLGQAVETVYSVLIKLALAPALAVFFIIPDLFPLIFGMEWATAGDVAKWMTPWLFFQFVVSPCTGIYPIIDRHDMALRFQVSLLVSSVLGAIIGGLYFKDLVSVVSIISILNCTVYLWRVVTTFRILGLSGFHAVEKIARSLPVSILISLPIIVCAYTLNKSALWIALGLVLTVVLWGLLILKPIIKAN